MKEFSKDPDKYMEYIEEAHPLLFEFYTRFGRPVSYGFGFQAPNDTSSIMFDEVLMNAMEYIKKLEEGKE